MSVLSYAIMTFPSLDLKSYWRIFPATNQSYISCNNDVVSRGRLNVLSYVIYLHYLDIGFWSYICPICVIDVTDSTSYFKVTLMSFSGVCWTYKLYVILSSELVKKQQVVYGSYVRHWRFRPVLGVYRT